MEFIIVKDADWETAKAAIENNKPVKKVSFIGKGPHKQPLDKPYTYYDENQKTINADDFILSTLKSEGISFVEVQSYLEWAKRFETIASLKKLVAESPISVDLGEGVILPLQAVIEEWYASKTSEVSSFMEDGNSDFYMSIKNAEDFWWDADGTNGTVREQAIAAIEPLIIKL